MNLKNIHNIYFMGIGGIGMSALARYFNANKFFVSGYDKTPSPVTSGLEDLGISIHFEDDISSIDKRVFNKEKTLIVYTPAIPEDHVEYNYFKDNGYTIYKRSEILGAITKNTFCFAVAGTHGKTTTSTILGHILHEANVNATSFLGGIAVNYNSNLILGGDEISVVEADEFDRSFLRLSPNMACITSMDADHLDIYGEAEALTESFNDFANLVSDKLFIRKGLPIKGISYGIEENADYDAKNIRIQNGTYIFDVQTPSELYENIEINIPGRHNVLNTVVALAMADSYGVPLATIAEALKTFKGIQRRFNYKIKTDDLVLIDDYAHHPTEIDAVANAVGELFPKEKILAVFQPHLFSRTRDFIDDFAKSLSKFDELILLDIYPAREKPIEGVTSELLLSKVDSKEKKISSKENLIATLKASDAKIIVMIGAGDIGVLVEDVYKNLK
ncbi:UDP-N-acetylmuramate--L-alanine ligase [Aureibaculum sp. 2210JD6-5]|uniref:UDP-N-acetylmuramate--L-alanine ligase n=1 Tax=Aureibaculum sp. 2210JD6-5 TaxID=3103957 RepID=UPI002AAEA9C8|nr:UDP-N-acetylmuramate--L-alanine ligase [Aureibaculum sp. 2210JD6-5]MDY7394523.1 UDP-N-acetylmuramate--L-alanine ligase [Aureibaculum sp. 2210JD6-5]